LQRSMNERSAGAVIVNESKGRRRYLLLLNAGRWDFPKGNVEKGETDEQTAVREVQEETGLKAIALVPGFMQIIEYFYRRGKRTIHKEVVFFLAKSKEDEVTISHEHQGYGWFSYEDSLVRASHKNSRRVLEEAEKFISGRSLVRASALRTEPEDASRKA
jgi:bis(5'-nucleosidyl)-tetraphosphatase